MEPEPEQADQAAGPRPSPAGKTRRSLSELQEPGALKPALRAVPLCRDAFGSWMVGRGPNAFVGINKRVVLFGMSFPYTTALSFGRAPVWTFSDARSRMYQHRFLQINYYSNMTADIPCAPLPPHVAPPSSHYDGTPDPPYPMRAFALMVEKIH